MPDPAAPAPRKPCCTPQRDPAAAALGPSGRAAPASTGEAPPVAWIALAGGTFTMGTDSPEGFAADGEGPSRRVTLRPFRVAPTAVTNRSFAAFVRATRYITEAERLGSSFVFHLQLPRALRETSPAPAGLPWWRAVDHACWQRPEGPGSQVHARPDHPVVHVSWNDAMAYCAWADARLPTEAEWECAARGGLEGARYAWGDEKMPQGQAQCNIWQGHFPDGPAHDWQPGPMRVDAFAPNGFGLYNCCGNVWEWCADAFSAHYHRETPNVDPRGRGDDADDRGPRSMRGGSFLCHDSYCNRYRLAARSASPPASAASNIGFRVAADAR